MKESKFTGSAWGLFGWNIVIAVATMLFVIPVVFVIPKYMEWYYSHVTIDGKKIKFEHQGPWWGYLGWQLFAVITLGIGSWYAMKKMIQWEVKHLSAEGEDGKSAFTGEALSLFGYNILVVISMYLFVLPFAWAFVSYTRYIVEEQMISGKRLKFDYQGPWFGVLGWILFTFVTLGLGGFYAQKKMIQWQFAHTHFASAE